MQSACHATSGPFQGSTCAHLSSYNRFTLDDMPACRPKQWTCPVQTSDFHFKEKVLITNARNGIVEMFLRSQKDKWQKTSKIFFTKKSFLIELNWTWTENEKWIRLMQVPVDRNGLAEWVWRSGSRDWQQWIITAMDGWWCGIVKYFRYSLNFWQWLNISILSSIYPDRFSCEKKK